MVSPLCLHPYSCSSTDEQAAKALNTTPPPRLAPSAPARLPPVRPEYRPILTPSWDGAGRAPRSPSLSVTIPSWPTAATTVIPRLLLVHPSIRTTDPSAPRDDLTFRMPLEGTTVPSRRPTSSMVPTMPTHTRNVSMCVALGLQTLMQTITMDVSETCDCDRNQGCGLISRLYRRPGRHLPCSGRHQQLLLVW